MPVDLDELARLEAAATPGQLRVKAEEELAEILAAGRTVGK